MRDLSRGKPPNNTEATSGSGASATQNDVYVSFRGPDIGSTFIDFLYHAMVGQAIGVCRESEILKAGDQIDDFLGVIDDSKVFIPVLSSGYAASAWCLIELARAVELNESTGEPEILPIFYDVTPRDVRLETGRYGRDLQKHEERHGSVITQQWDAALRKVASIKGWEVQGKSHGELIVSIVGEISSRLEIKHRHVLEDQKHNYEPEDLSTCPTREQTRHRLQRMALSSEADSTSELEDGQESEIIKLLELEVKDVRIVGIHGRDGIGKTALAKIVYEKISPRFDACSFLAEIEETTQQPGGVQYLQTNLIFDILKREYEAASAFEEVEFLKEIFRNMKVLIVLDDVERGFPLEEFVGDKLDWFGSGSRIIVTSKERSVLQGFVHHRGLAPLSYDVVPMHHNQAFEFFWHCAIGKSDELKSVERPLYTYIANNIVKAMKGIPLLLEIFGSFLHGKGQEEWIKFDDLIQQSQEDYLEVLSRIYDALDEQQKFMYLEIACFPPYVDCQIASYMWHDYDHPNEVMEVLRRMSLIKTEENKIGMHSMLRRLALKIIHQDYDLGTGVGLSIPATAQTRPRRNRKQIPLKFLSLGRANGGGEFADALSKVQWLHWQGCPPDAISIHLEENKSLTILDLSWSKVTESWDCWKGKTMEQLKVLNLTGCADLLVTPSFSCCLNLEMLILERCSRLVHLDPSVGDLKLLVTLNLKFCSELTMLPMEMGGMNALRELLIDDTAIRELPPAIGKLFQLQILSATNCFSLVSVPDSVCKLEALSVLAFDGAKILELPKSIGDLKNLRRLSLRDCRGLEMLPDSIGNLADSLVELDISGTGISQLPDSTERLWNLKVLKMDSCFIMELPPCIDWLTNLEELHASLCRSLGGEIPRGISRLSCLRELRLRGTRVSSLPSEIERMSSLQTLDLFHCKFLKELPTRPPPDLRNLDINPELKKKMSESSEFIRWSHLLV